MHQFDRTLQTLILLILCMGCGSPPPLPPESSRASIAEQLPSPNIENLFGVRSDIYSGGQPEGEAAFAELQKLGVKTILDRKSVV